MAAHKGGFSEEEKAEIIRLYTVEHRGKKYIGSLFGRSDYNIAYWLAKWGVDSISRSDISKTIRQVYGSTPGFSGRHHTAASKKQIAASGRKSWRKGNREAIIGKSRTYQTVVGKVLGKYEVAYLQHLFENQMPLPSLCRRRLRTPHGTYKPDFEESESFIEIKSEFTLRVAQGRYKTSEGIYCDKQWKKICYTNDHIKPVRVVVLDKKEAERLFKSAKEGVLCIT